MLIGKTSTEKHANDVKVCREIVSEILKYGVNQEQILRVMYLLSLELEEHEAMINTSAIIREHLPYLNEEKNSDIVLK
ncbi:hypothetical protein CL614_04495 [archaeon]|jgi:hypothetical protein|nr:hypothetical protein [archaeon]|tara:strand:- start:369 stop:602 length:234 start_codon:yes stop_codon:yes gene_type:complete